MEKDRNIRTNEKEFTGWVSCGIPVPQSDHADFWQRWAQAKDSRKCPCGEMVPGGPCPVCGREYDPSAHC